MTRAFGLLTLAALCVLLVPARADAAATTHVTIANYAYGPATVTVRVGDSVSWTNHDQAKHDVVTTSAPAAFRSPLLSAGQTYTFRFSQPGTYSYYCSLHPDMKATIVVQPANTPAPAPPPFRPPTQSTVTPTQNSPSPTASSPSPTASPPPSPPSPPSSTTSSSPPAVVAPEPAAQTRSLDPMLLVAGVTVGIATLCLLLISGRPDP